MRRRDRTKAPEIPPEVLAAQQRTEELQRREGTLPCTEHGCTAVTGIACDYTDRRDKHCQTAWCPEHRVVVNERVFCRRHAGVISALPAPESALVAALPDLDNRAPSLVAWMARLIDSDVWRLLLGEFDAEAGGHLIADPVMLVFTGVERERAWERTWKLVTHMGITRRVSLMVEEADDSTVAVKVGSVVVDRLQPPWIAHRKQGETVSVEIDQHEREAFNAQVLAAIEQGIAQEQQQQSWATRAQG
jgi:hypothetical protein